MLCAVPQLRAVAERAFWDVLAEGLAESPPAWRRLAALVTDAREQLAELVPPNDNPAAQALRLQLHDKLETVGGGHRECVSIIGVGRRQAACTGPVRMS